MANLRDNEPGFETGRIVVSTGNLDTLEVNLTNKRIDVNVEDKSFIKRIIQMRNEINQTPPLDTQEDIVREVKKKQSDGPLKMLRTVADALKVRGITLTISYKGKTVVTIGADAKPTILQIVTKTRAVAINSFYRLLRMVI